MSDPSQPGRLPEQAPIPEAAVAVSAPQAENRGWYLRRRLVTALVIGAGVLGGTTAIGEGSPVEGARQVIERVDEGIRPNVPVSRTGTELMIKANDALLDYGKYEMYGLFGLYASLYAMRRSRLLRASFNDVLDYDKLDQAKLEDWAMKLVASTAIAFGAMSMSLAGNAASNANAPTKLVTDALGSNGNATFLAPQENYIPFNHANIQRSDFGIIASEVQKAGGSMAPVFLQLGDLKAAGKELKPSSAPIVGIPKDAFEKEFGVNINTPKEGECGDMQVVVGKQLGTEPGDTVLLDQQPAKVVGEVDVHAGLDRVLAIGPLEQLQNCLFKGEPYSGAIVLGLDGGPEKLQEIIDLHNMQPYHAETMPELSVKYEKFWKESIEPQEVLLASLLGLLSAAAITGFKLSSVLQRRRHIAADLTQQIEEERLIGTEWVRSLKEVVIASWLGAGGVFITSAATNSAQFGIDQAASLESWGAGVAIASTAVFAGTAIGSIFRIKKVNPAMEMRNTI
jgi:hypothetical protein